MGAKCDVYTGREVLIKAIAQFISTWWVSVDGVTMVEVGDMCITGIIACLTHNLVLAGYGEGRRVCFREIDHWFGPYATNCYLRTTK